MSDHERIAQIAHFFANNERFAQKTSERIPNPAGLLHKFLAHKQKSPVANTLSVTGGSG